MLFNDRFGHFFPYNIHKNHVVQSLIFDNKKKLELNCSINCSSVATNKNMNENGFEGEMCPFPFEIHVQRWLKKQKHAQKI